MPRFVAVYTMKPEDVAAFRARPKSEQETIDKAGLNAWEEWRKRNAAAIVASDVMVGKTRRVTKTGIVDAQNQIAGFLIVEAADIATPTGWAVTSEDYSGIDPVARARGLLKRPEGQTFGYSQASTRIVNGGLPSIFEQPKLRSR